MVLTFIGMLCGKEDAGVQNSVEHRSLTVTARIASQTTRKFLAFGRVRRLFCLIVLVANASPGADSVEGRLKSFLHQYARSRNAPMENQVRFSYALFDLNGDGQKEAIIHLVGPGWCGSGGCPTLILRPAGKNYQEVCGILITRAPIKVLAARTKGWHNISVFVAGGGISPGYEAELRFDGAKYPRNPSMPPARPLSPSAAGVVVISQNAVEIPLYP